jgi:phosphate starvation-inducible PhoH-like protein
MREPNRPRKGEIKAINKIQLNEEQKEAKRLIIDNQIVVITGRAGSGKSLISAQAALDFLINKQCDKIYVTRATVEVGSTLGYLPGSLDEKFNPYLEAFIENLYKCADKLLVDDLIKNKKIEALPVQFVRGKTVDDILVIEESQNLTSHEMEALLTRLGKTGKIIINGDNEQRDVKTDYTGLSFAIELSKKIDGIEWVKLKANHRSDLVGKILDYIYNKS